MSKRTRMRLSEANVARLAPREREYSVWDTRVPGLGVRVRPSGHCSYIFLRQIAGRSTRVSLGPVTLKRVDEARRECLEIAASAQRGERPSEDDDSRSKGVLFADFVSGQWSAGCYERYKPSTRKGVRALLRAQLVPAFGDLPLEAITRERVRKWFDAYSATSPGGANQALKQLRQILNYAIACGRLEKHSLRGVRRNPRTPLNRFLSGEEVVHLHRVLDRYRDARPSLRRQAEVIRLLLLTGCRRSEIVHLRWQEVGHYALSLTDGKTGPRTVHLNAQARAIIERQPRGLGGFVFPSPRDPSCPICFELPLWYTVREQAGIEDVRLHDLRHSFASHAVMNGVPIPVVSRLLGHSNVRMTLRYAHLADKDIEAAAERIGAAMASIIELP